MSITPSHILKTIGLESSLSALLAIIIIGIIIKLFFNEKLQKINTAVSKKTLEDVEDRLKENIKEVEERLTHTISDIKNEFHFFEERIDAKFSRLNDNLIKAISDFYKINNAE